MAAPSIGGINQLASALGNSGGGGLNADFLKQLAQLLGQLQGPGTQPRRGSFPVFPEFTASLPQRSLTPQEVNPFVRGGDQLGIEEFSPDLLRILARRLQGPGF